MHSSRLDHGYLYKAMIDGSHLSNVALRHKGARSSLFQFQSGGLGDPTSYLPNPLEYRTPQNKCHKPKIALPWHHGMLVWTTLKVRGVQMGAVVVDIQQGPRPMPNNRPHPSLKPDKVRSCGHIHTTSTNSGGKSLVLLLKARKCWGTDISARRFDSNVLALWRNDPRRNKFLHITTSICQERSEIPNTHHVSVRPSC